MVLIAENCAIPVAFVEDGRNFEYVPRILHVDRSTIRRAVEHFRQTVRNKRRAGSGRK